MTIQEYVAADNHEDRLVMAAFSALRALARSGQERESFADLESQWRLADARADGVADALAAARR